MEKNNDLPNYTVSECSNGPKAGAVKLKEFVVRWDYDGNGKILVTINDENEKFIQSLEHVKSKI